MRILQISAYFYPSFRGTEQTVYSLSLYLSRLGHQVDVLTINTEGAPKEETIGKGVRVFRCSPSLRYHRGIFSLEFSRRMLKARDYDLYHLHMPFPYGLEVAVAASRLNHIPLVASVHSESRVWGDVGKILKSLIGDKSPPEGEGRRVKDTLAFLGAVLLARLLVFAYNAFYRHLSVRFVDRFLFFTRSYARSLGLSPKIYKRMRFVPPAVDTQRFSPFKDAPALRAKHRFTQTDKIVLFVGTLHSYDRYRGADYLIQAMAKVRKEVPEARLLVVGGGGWVPFLERMSGELNLSDTVTFVGPVFGEELAGYYAICDVFVLPSTYEAYGFVILEAMASGKPVIVTDIPGAGEVVTPGLTGLRVPPGDRETLAESIISLLRNEELRRQMGENGRRQTEARAWQTVAEEILKVYQEVVKA